MYIYIYVYNIYKHTQKRTCTYTRALARAHTHTHSLTHTVIPYGQGSRHQRHDNAPHCLVSEEKKEAEKEGGKKAYLYNRHSLADRRPAADQSVSELEVAAHCLPRHRIHLSTFMCVCVCVCVCMYECVRARMYTHTQTQTLSLSLSLSLSLTHTHTHNTSLFSRDGAGTMMLARSSA